MVSLLTQKDLRGVQRLPFCYLCGKTFADRDAINRDHVPPESAIDKQHRQPLLLPTHVVCNSAYHALDEQIGQLIALRYGKVPSVKAKKLKLAISRDGNTAAILFGIDQAVWRWIAGFHAALYKEPPLGLKGSLVTPFPRGQEAAGAVVVEELRPQHEHFVQTIVQNRAKGNLDRLTCNKGKVIYECVWVKADNDGPWFCVFALDIYDWKDLGRTRQFKSRGCAGHYIMPEGTAPPAATKGDTSKIVVALVDPRDPFSSLQAY